MYNHYNFNLLRVIYPYINLSNNISITINNNSNHQSVNKNYNDTLDHSMDIYACTSIIEVVNRFSKIWNIPYKISQSLKKKYHYNLIKLNLSCIPLEK